VARALCQPPLPERAVSSGESHSGSSPSCSPFLPAPFFCVRPPRLQIIVSVSVATSSRSGPPTRSQIAPNARGASACSDTDMEGSMRRNFSAHVSGSCLS